MREMTCYIFLLDLLSCSAKYLTPTHWTDDLLKFVDILFDDVCVIKVGTGVTLAPVYYATYFLIN